MPTTEPFIDVHCHLAPGLDDGAATPDDALAMARMAVADGIATIVVTPHQLGGNAKNSGRIVREAVGRLQERLDRHCVPLRVLPGADVRIEPDLVRKVRDGEVVTLADRRRHVLLELPHEVYVPLDGLLAELAAAGLTGILSHPERNQGILNRPHLVRPLVERGCLLQVTAGSLTGTFGTAVRELAEMLVQEGLVHFIATDAHGTRARRPVMSEAFQRAADLTDRETALDLCCRNPAAVVAGEKISPCRRKIKIRTWSGWFTRTFATERSAVCR